MKHRRNRWVFTAFVAIALGTLLMTQPPLAPLGFSSTAKHNAQGHSAPPVNVSWQDTLMVNRW